MVFTRALYCYYSINNQDSTNAFFIIIDYEYLFAVVLAVFCLHCSEKWTLAQPRGGLLGFGWLGGGGGSSGGHMQATGGGIGGGGGGGDNSFIEDTYKVGSGGMDIY
jgi:hypothetical protein